MDIGAHCSKSDCHQVDFLPFTCDCCDRVFCLAHRSYDAHACPSAGSRDRRVVQCPLCKQMLRWTLQQDVNLVWDEHMQSGACVPNPHATTTALDRTSGELTTQKKKKQRCSAERCREVLLSSNQFHCNKCGLDVCLRHRFESDHDCERVRQQRRQQRARPWGLAATTTTTATKTAPSRTSTNGYTAPPPPVNALKLQENARAAATTVVNGTRSAVNTLVQKGKAVAASASAVTSSTEQCPICQRKFAYVSQLIAHVNRAHPDIDTRSSSAHASASSSSSGANVAATTASATGREVCPQCRAVFSDVTALISHVESAHSSTSVAAAAGGSDQEKCLVM